MNFLASSSVPSDTYTPEQLLTGDGVRTMPKVFKSGNNVLRLTVLAAMFVATAVSSVKASGANTGNGTLTVDATAPVTTAAQPGVYTVRCVTAATDAGTLRVYDPSGNEIGEVAVGATFSAEIKFATADGSTDFIVGDGFDIAVYGTHKMVPCVRTATNGSQIACAIAVEDTDATSADVTGPIYVDGEFAMQGLVWDASFTTAAQKLDAFPVGSSIVIKQLGYSGG
jgi:hypothetical protein